MRSPINLTRDVRVRRSGPQFTPFELKIVEANAAASACERSSAWQRALAILHGGLLAAAELERKYDFMAPPPAPSTRCPF